MNSVLVSQEHRVSPSPPPQVKMTDELMKLQTYDRLFQRLASACGQIPLGIYRSVPIDSCAEIQHSERPQQNPDAAARFLQSRMKLLGMDDGSTSELAID